MKFIGYTIYVVWLVLCWAMTEIIGVNELGFGAIGRVIAFIIAGFLGYLVIRMFFPIKWHLGVYKGSD